MTGKRYEQPSGHVRVESDLFQITDIGRIQVSICCPLMSPRAGYIGSYLSAFDTLVKVAFSVVPMLLTATTIMIEMKPAIRAYSIAVAAESTFKKRRIRLLMRRFQCHPETLVIPRH
jgi:hypothetical protein